jgi:hypothetical protein
MCILNVLWLNISEKKPREQWLRTLAKSEVSSPDNKQQEQQLCIYNTHFEKSNRDRPTITSVREAGQSSTP